MKKIILYLVGSFCFLATSCGNFATPQALIKAPNVDKVMASSVDLKSIAQSYLPQGAKLLNTNEIVTGKSVYAMDLDGDKQNEILAFFKMENSFEKGFVVLKHKDKEWEKIQEVKSECISISRLELNNVVNKDKKSLIVGFLISSHAGTSYKVYTFEDNKFKETFLGIWNKFEILNTPSDKDKNFVFAGWQNFVANVERADVFVLSNQKIYYGTDYNNNYEKFIEYYSNFIKENPNNESAWYLLAEAQLKSGMIDEFHKSMGTASQIEESKKYFPVSSNQFQLLNAKDLANEKQYNSALSILDKISKNIQNKIDNSKDSGVVSIDYENHYLAEVYTEYGKIYLNINDNKKAKEYFEKALNIFENLNKKGYYGDDGYVDIHRDADINTIKLYLEKLE